MPTSNSTPLSTAATNNIAYAVTIGAANVDILGTPDGELKLQDSSIGEVSVCAGGVGFNIASNLALLGSDSALRSRFISLLGDDANAVVIRQQAESMGVDITHCQQLTGARTSVYLSVLDQQKDMHVAINDMAIYQQLSPELLAAHADMIDKATVLVLDTNLSQQALAYLLERHSDLPIFIDAVSTVKAVKIRDLLASVHTLKTNLQEAEALSGIKLTTEDSSGIDGEKLETAAAWFHQRGVKRIFITSGPDGLFYSEITYDGISANQISAKPVTIANGNGAGDALVAALAYGFCQQWPTEQCAEFASAAAAVALSHQATVHPQMSFSLVQATLQNSLS